jgi:Fe2+ transport system protein FeoA
MSQGMSAPAVSVIMACHNAAAFIQDAIGSIVRQSLYNLELIVVDDGSTDGSPAITEAWAARDSRVTVIRLDGNRGAAAARNLALGRVRGEWVAILDADDVAQPDRLEAQLEYARRDDRTVLVGADSVEIDEGGRVLGRFRYPAGDAELRRRLLALGAFPPHSSMLIRHAALARTSGYDQRFVPSEDYELYCRLAPLGRFASVGRPLVQMRRYSGSLSAIGGGRTQVVHALAANLCHRLRAAGLTDPSAETRAGAWDAFVGWLSDRLRTGGYFEQAGAWDRIRCESGRRRSRASALVRTGSAFVRSSLVRATVWERLGVRRPWPERLMQEWSGGSRV